MTKNNESGTDLEFICSLLLNGEVDNSAIVLTLGEFEQLYKLLVENLENRIPKTSIINLGNELFIQFSNISPQHFLIIGKNSFVSNDFRFLLSKNWFGINKKQKTFCGFIINEFKLNSIPLLLTITFSFIALVISNNYDIIATTSNLVMQGATIFLSIFLIFTITQNQILYKDIKLFQAGILQNFYQDDRHLATLSIFTIIATILNTLLADIFKNNCINIQIKNVEINPQWILAFTTSILIASLLNSFLAVKNYYLFRTKDVIERDLVSEIFHNEFKSNYKSDDNLAN